MHRSKASLMELQHKVQSAGSGRSKKRVEEAKAKLQAAQHQGVEFLL